MCVTVKKCPNPKSITRMRNADCASEKCLTLSKSHPPINIKNHFSTRTNVIFYLNLIEHFDSQCICSLCPRVLWINSSTAQSLEEIKKFHGNPSCDAISLQFSVIYISGFPVLRAIPRIIM